MAARDFHLEKVKVAVQVGVISIPEALEAMRAINSGNDKIIKELYRERHYDEKLATR